MRLQWALGDLMGLLLILAFGILTLWAPSRWALAAFQLAILFLAARNMFRWACGQAGDQRGEHPANPSRWPRRVVSMGIAVGAVGLWGLLQVGLDWSVDRNRTLAESLNWLVNLCAVLLGADLVTRAGADLHRRVLDPILYFSSAVALLALLTLASSPEGVIAWSFDVGTGLPTLGPFVYRNQFAAFAEVGLAIAVTRALLGSRPAPYLACGAVLFGAVVAGGSRGGTVLCLAEVLVIPAVALWQRRVEVRRGGKVAVAAVLSLLLGGAVAGWGYVADRFGQDNPYALRADLLDSSLQMAADRPWTGYGLGTWAEVYPGYARFDDGLYVNQAHGDWAQWAAEGGLPVFALLLGVFLLLLRPAVQSLWGVGMLAVAVHCFFDYPMQQRPALAAFFFAVIGMISAVENSAVPRLRSDLTAPPDIRSSTPGRGKLRP